MDQSKKRFYILTTPFYMGENPLTKYYFIIVFFVSLLLLCFYFISVVRFQENSKSRWKWKGMSTDKQRMRIYDDDSNDNDDLVSYVHTKKSIRITFTTIIIMITCLQLFGEAENM